MTVTPVQSIINDSYNFNQNIPRMKIVEYYNRIGKCYVKEASKIQQDIEDNICCSTFALYG